MSYIRLVNFFFWPPNWIWVYPWLNEFGSGRFICSFGFAVVITITT